MATELPEPSPAPTLPTDRRALLAGIGGLAAGAILAGKASAGPLTPPPGPIAPTPGPEPRIAVNAISTPGNATALFRITQPGSYYLTGNVSGVSGKHGIEITATGVTLDLGGFRLLGAPGSLDGVAVQTLSGRGIVIRNGSVQAWGDCGIEFNIASGSPSAGLVSEIDASSNARTGILAAASTRIERCTASGNGSDGITVERASAVINSTATLNGGDGIRTNSGCTILGTTAATNGSNGFSLGNGNTVDSCTAYDNSLAGFSAGRSSFVNCTAYLNDDHGFLLFADSSAIGCAAYQNKGSGFDAFSCVITGSIASSNDLDGIRVFANSTVRGNQCSANGRGTAGGAGIRATASDNRIEDNNCVDADRGIEVDAAGNFIARNTCSGNTTNWSIAFGNACLVVPFSAAPAINGDSGGISPGSANPNANYTY